MKMKRIQGLISFALVAMILLPVGSTVSGYELFRRKQGPVGEKHTTVVEALDAQREIGDGTLWRIYLRASDPDGDLDRVQITFFSSPGMYAPEQLILPASKQKQANGAILIWARLNGGDSTTDIYGEIEIRVEDRAGNLSNPKKLEFTVQEYGMYDEFVPSAAFNRDVVLGQAQFPLETTSATDKS
jgi:hypothetical protein